MLAVVVVEFFVVALIQRNGLKKSVILHQTPAPLPPHLSGRNKTDLCAMKQILYDMGPLTHVKWPLYRALKV